jgi:hypothetical protein
VTRDVGCGGPKCERGCRQVRGGFLCDEDGLQQKRAAATLNTKAQVRNDA